MEAKQKDIIINNKEYKAFFQQVEDSDTKILEVKDYLGERVGFISFCESYDVGPIIWINKVFVSEKFRRQGVGSYLLKVVENYAINHKCVSVDGKMYLGESSKECLLNFYEKAGFVFWIDGYTKMVTKYIKEQTKSSQEFEF
jgi:GNAT superfamily N-acetyltransferase